jgi:hypothetical protein
MTGRVVVMATGRPPGDQTGSTATTGAILEATDRRIDTTTTLRTTPRPTAVDETTAETCPPIKEKI